MSTCLGHCWCAIVTCHLRRSRETTNWAASGPVAGANQAAYVGFRSEAPHQRQQALLDRLEQLLDPQQPQGPQSGSQPAAASGSGQPSQAQQAAAPTAPSAAQPSIGDQAGPSAANPTQTGGRRSPPYPALFRTPAQPPTGSDAARGLAQVLGDNRRPGLITSAMFGSAMEAAMTSARQVIKVCFIVRICWSEQGFGCVGTAAMSSMSQVVCSEQVYEAAT